MPHLRRISLSMFIAFLVVTCSRVLPLRASGEIMLIKAPDEIPEGDDLTVAISATARETGVDRSVTIEIPDSWRLKRAWRVEAGSDVAVALPQVNEIRDLFSAESAHTVVACADNGEFDPDAPGVAYFFTFETKALAGSTANQSVTLKAALVERSNPDAPAEIDKKTKKPIARNTDWHMVYPPRPDFAFGAVSTKRTVRMLRLARMARALVVEGPATANATLKTRPEILQEYMRSPFSISCWFRTTSYQQNLLRFTGDNGKAIQLGIGLLGQPYLTMISPQPHSLIAAKAIANDGAWHHLVLSKDNTNTLRLFIDAGTPAVKSSDADTWTQITGIRIGGKASGNDFSIDELRLLTQAYTQPAEYESTIATAARDTMSNVFAIFHLDDFGPTAHTSQPLLLKRTETDRGEFVPIMLALDSGATIEETTSPVQLEPVMLSADLLSPTKVNISWHTSSEVGIKQYRLERRVGSFGAFEKVLTVDAKHGIRTPKKGQSIISRNSYSAVEDLPKLNGDIELYYRLAIVGFDEKNAPSYSQSIDLEYGVDRDVFVEQNQPNPFNPTTSIAFRVTKPTQVRLSIFDIIGREVAVLVNGKVETGRHVYTLDATNWPGGIYFYKVKTQRSTVTRKMVLAK